MVLVLFSAQAQNKKLTIEEAVAGQYRQFYPDRVINFLWKDAKNYTFTNDYRSVLIQKVGAKKHNVLLGLTDLNAWFTAADLDTLNYIFIEKWLNNHQFSLYQNNGFFVVDINKKAVVTAIQYPETAENVVYDYASGYLTYTKENNLFIKKGDKETAVTNDTDKAIVNGQTVHRSEFGINGGIFWSPKGSLLAYYKKDESMVSDYPLVDVTQRVAELNNIKYPMAGMKSEEVRLVVYNPKTKTNTLLEATKNKEDYLTNITWGAQEKYIYIQVLNREQNHMWLNQYDAKTGQLVKTLFEETHPKYVEPEHHLVFLKNNPNQFIYFSERDGFMHTYLYDTSGKLIKQLTKGKWLVKSFTGFDQSGNLAIFATTYDSPLGTQYITVNLKNNKIKKITPEAGTHRIILNPNSYYFSDAYSSIKVSGKTNIRTLKGKLVQNILTSKDKLADYQLANMKIGTIKSADQKTDLYYRLITPPNLDANKKYPVIVYVYGGPHAQLIQDSWLASSQLWLYYLAQEGFVVFTVDSRGSDNRGRDFENVIHRQLGQAEMADQLEGIKFLKSLPYVDANRIGVDGWSFGGFMTTNLLLSYPETFKVGVAGGPVINWEFYEIMYGERYMDTPQENPEGYEQANLTKKVKNLKGHLMIIHGAQDPTVVWQHSQVFLRECIKNGVLLDYFIYPTHEHNVRGYDRVHLMKKITRYFKDYL